MRRDGKAGHARDAYAFGVIFHELKEHLVDLG